MKKLAVVSILLACGLASQASAQSNGGPGAGFFGGGGFGYAPIPHYSHACIINNRLIATPGEAAARGVPCVKAFEQRTSKTKRVRK
jgi:hypothetical protein